MDYFHFDGLEEELALDAKGRKHVEKHDNADAMYTEVGNLETCRISFPGQTSSDALRTFLQSRLPTMHVTNEYDKTVLLADITNGHLPTLQAKLWCDIAGQHATDTTPPTSTTTYRYGAGPFLRDSVATVSSDKDDDWPRKDEVLYATHIQTIAHLLDGKFLALII